jgi:hypothetical protein
MKKQGGILKWEGLIPRIGGNRTNCGIKTPVTWFIYLEHARAKRHSSPPHPGAIERASLFCRLKKRGGEDPLNMRQSGAVFIGGARLDADGNIF